MPHRSTSSPRADAYARMHVSTASMCFRNDSLWTYRVTSAHASARSTLHFCSILRCYRAGGNASFLQGTNGHVLNPCASNHDGLRSTQ